MALLLIFVPQICWDIVLEVVVIEYQDKVKGVVISYLLDVLNNKVLHKLKPLIFEKLDY